MIHPYRQRDVDVLRRDIEKAAGRGGEGKADAAEVEAVCIIHSLNCLKFDAEDHLALLIIWLFNIWIVIAVPE